MKIQAKYLLLAALAAPLLGLGAGAMDRPDSWITTKVKTSLATHKGVSATGTNVDTKDGVVTLRGKVDTEAEKELAGRVALGIEGVRMVNNELQVKGAPAEDRGYGDQAVAKTSDGWITSRVKAA